MMTEDEPARMAREAFWRALGDHARAGREPAPESLYAWRVAVKAAQRAQTGAPQPQRLRDGDPEGLGAIWDDLYGQCARFMVARYAHDADATVLGSIAGAMRATVNRLDEWRARQR